MLKPRYFNEKIDNFEINVKNSQANTSHYTLLTFFDLVLFSSYSVYPFLSTENYIYLLKTKNEIQKKIKRNILKACTLYIINKGGNLLIFKIMMLAKTSDK